LFDAAASRDLNPIHRSPILAALAGLPRPITHGMWTSAAAYRALWAALDAEMGNAAAGGAPLYSWGAQAAIVSVRARFTGMVFPGDALLAQVAHTGTHVRIRARTRRLHARVGLRVTGPADAAAVSV
jgi:fatty acid synthase